MAKRIIFYFVASIFMLISFLFFGRASNALTNFSKSLNRHNVAYNSFQTLSRQITKAAFLTYESANHSDDTRDVHVLFFVDSLSIFRELQFLKSSVKDSLNLRVANELDSDLRSELSWILGSNVRDSMIHHRSSRHIASFKKINSLIEQGIKRTGFLVLQDNKRLDKAILTVRVWIIVFIIHSVILLLYTANDIYTQNYKRKQKQKQLESSHRSLEDAQRMGDKNISDIKISEHLIFESERKYQHLFENNPMPMWVIDRTTLSFLDVNRSTLFHYGYSRSEFLAMSSVDINSPDEKKRFEDILFKVCDEPHLGGIWKHLKKDDSVIQVEIIFHDINFGDRQACLVLITDITEKLKHEGDLKASYQQLQDLTAHLQNVREEERTSIAREIHDDLGQQLTALKIDVSWIGKKLANEDKAITDTLSGMILLIDETVKAVRRISSELRPGILDDLGLIAAIEWQCQEFERRTAIKSECSVHTCFFVPDRGLATNIFRVYQEALTNVARHSQATRVDTMLVESDDHIELIVKDNGVGFDVGQSKTRKSWGLVGMKERALMFKGDLFIQSNNGEGTVIRLKIPMESVEVQKIKLP